MASIGNLIVNIGAKIDGLSKGFADAQGMVNNAASKFKSVAGALTPVTAAMGVAVGAIGLIGGATIGAGSHLLNLGSNAAEMQAKFDQVFGNFGGQVTAELDTFGNTVGRSTYELQGMAANMQDLLVPLGFARGEAARMSTDLTKLAVDLGSFNNLDSAEVMRDLQAGLTGETDSLKKYGIIANEAAIKQEALNLGLSDGKGQLDAQSKALAIMSIITRSTADAQGDATRTAGGWANQMRALQATANETGTAMGLALLPVFEPLLQNVTQFATQVGPMAVGVFTQFAGTLNGTMGPALLLIGDAWTRIVVAFGGTAEAATPANTAMMALNAGLNAIVTVVQVVALGAQGLAWTIERVSEAVTVVTGIWSNFNAILASNSTDPVVVGIQTLTAMISNAFSPFEMINQTTENAIGLWNQLGEVWANIKMPDLQLPTMDTSGIPEWLIPHSPPPFAQGLEMVNEQLTQLSNNKNAMSGTVPMIERIGNIAKINRSNYNQWSAEDQYFYQKNFNKGDGVAEDGSRVGAGYYRNTEIERLERHFEAAAAHSEQLAARIAEAEQRRQQGREAEQGQQQNQAQQEALAQQFEVVYNRIQSQPITTMVNLDGQTIAKVVSHRQGKDVSAQVRMGGRARI